MVLTQICYCFRILCKDSTATSRKIQQICIPLVVLLSRTKHSGYYIENKLKKALSSGKKARTLGSKEQHSDKFVPGATFSFLLFLIYPRHEPEEAGSMQMPAGIDKTKQSKVKQNKTNKKNRLPQKPALSGQSTRKGMAEQNEKLTDNKFSTPTKHHQKPHL